MAISNNLRFTFLILLTCFIGIITTEAQCSDDDNYWAESWKSCTETINPNSARGESHWILYEFNEPIGIADTHIWNANQIGSSNSGIKEVLIDVSKDGNTWIPVTETPLVWEKAPETNEYEGFEGLNLSSFGFIQKVLVTVVSTHGDSCASLAEIRFDVDLNACDGIRDACNVCDGPGFITFYLDADGDGQGNQNNFIQSCELPEAGYVTNNDDECDTGGWEQIGAIFETNSCTGCHGANGESGLDLTSYEGFLLGGDICGTNIHSGTTLVNIIEVAGYDECGQPIGGMSMNSRVDNKLDALEIAAIQAWIDAGAPKDAACQETIEETDENEAKRSTTVYPNPTKGPVTFRTDANDKIEVVQVFKVNGQLVTQFYNGGNPITNVDLSSLPSGVYLLQLFDGSNGTNKKSTHKVILE